MENMTITETAGLSRRSFITGATVAGALAALGLAGCAPQSPRDKELSATGTAPADISWDEETNSIEIGVPPVPGQVTITVENRSNDGPPAPTPSNEPEYGLVIGNLEEIDPHTVGDVITADPGSYYIRSTRMQSPDGSFPEITAHPRPASKGESYLVYSVTNNGETPKDITVMRPVSIASRREMFPTLHVQPGETLVRVFRILKDEETHPMQRTFSFGVGSSVTDRTIRPQERPVSDVTVSLLNINRV